MSIETTTLSNFNELGLSEPILRAISDAGYTTPTPIQAKAIPQVLSGGDLLAGAQTGTGKTAGYFSRDARPLAGSCEPTECRFKRC